jgi:hypothetical protein
MRLIGLACGKADRDTPTVRKNATGFQIGCTGTLRSDFAYTDKERGKVIQKWIPIVS